MSREITTHQVSPLDTALSIHVLDEPGHGGANHEYFIAGLTDLPEAPSSIQQIKADGYAVRIPFQNGPVGENGVNGVSNEALLAVVADRLEGFQAGPYACEDNGLALAKIRSAMEDLQRRTKERLARNVEGTSQV